MTTWDLTSEPIMGSSSRLRPRNWGLAVKLLVTLLVPTLLALGLGGLRILDQIQTANALTQSDRYATVQDAAGKLTAELLRERDRAAVLVAVGRTADPASAQASYAATDAGWQQVRRQFGDPAALPSAVAVAYRGAQDGIGKLAELRVRLTNAPPARVPAAPPIGVPAAAPIGVPAAAPGQPAAAPPAVQTSAASEVVKQYTAIIQPVLLLRSVLSRQLQAPGIVELGAAFEAVGAIRDEIAQQHALVAAAIVAGGRLPAGDVDAVRAADARLTAAVDELESVLTPDRLASLGGFLTSPNYELFNQLTQGAIRSAATNQPLGTSQADWDGAYDRLIGDLGRAESGIRDEIAAISVAQINDANNLAGTNGAILLLAILLATTIMVMVVRAMLRSLRTLRVSALEVAERRLPEAVQSMRAGQVPDITVQPVPVTTREEIGQVARAFDAVHSQAVRLAAEQATLQANVSSMFVNLSRRSQGLVERQLELIERLESNEEDPDQLSNLFQLDHLATRMRRNSENLLVLAGEDPTRRGGQPVPLVDVLRAAVSEVEQYQRILVQPPPLARVLGRAASDLVHLLAELLDNATIYSAPSTQVLMVSSRPDDGSVLIEIVDRGVGMSAEDLADANDRISGPPSVDVSASRRMGLFVVGRLAARHGLVVRLSSGPGLNAGVTASVSVPTYVVTRTVQRPLDATGPLDRSDGLPLMIPPQPPGPSTAPGIGPVNGLGRVPALPGSLATWDVSDGMTNGAASGPDVRGEPGGPRPFGGWRARGTAESDAGPSTGPAGSRVARVAGALFGGPEAEARPTPDPAARAEPDQSAPPDQQAPEQQAPEQQAPEQQAPALPADEQPGDEQPADGDATDESTAEESTSEEAEESTADEPDGLDEAWATETTPIFEEIASAWFSAQRLVPVDWHATERDEAALSEPPATADRAPSATQTTAPSPLPRRVPAKATDAAVAAARPAAEPTAASARPEPASPDNHAPSVGVPSIPKITPPEPQWPAQPHSPAAFGPRSSEFASPADVGWEAAQSLVEPDVEEVPEGLTEAGLPRRRPRARLIPGSAGPAGPAGRASRTAEQIRGLLASYQAGIRQGRADRRRPPQNAAGATAGWPPETRDEEPR